MTINVTRAQIARNHCSEGTRLWDKHMGAKRKSATLRSLLRKALKIKNKEDREEALITLARYGKVKKGTIKEALRTLSSKTKNVNTLREIIGIFNGDAQWAWSLQESFVYACLNAKQDSLLVDTFAPVPPKVQPFTPTPWDGSY